jgi:hypothetical protein
MKAALRNLAVLEESYFTDTAVYGSVARVRAAGVGSLPALPSGESITVHLDPTQGYCFAGRVAPGRYWIYSSEDGGLAGSPSASDTCSRTRYPGYGGVVG